MSLYLSYILIKERHIYLPSVRGNYSKRFFREFLLIYLDKRMNIFYKKPGISTAFSLRPKFSSSVSMRCTHFYYFSSLIALSKLFEENNRECLGLRFHRNTFSILTQSRYSIGCNPLRNLWLKRNKERRGVNWVCTLKTYSSSTVLSYFLSKLNLNTVMRTKYLW